MKLLDRRTFLRGAGGIALALPFLNAMTSGRAGAQGRTPPRRILFSFKPNGDQVSRRFIDKHETNFRFDEFLQPLEPYRNELLILDRVDKRFGRLDGQVADNHQQGGSSLAPWPSGEGSFPIGGTDRSIGYVLGPSADHAIGDRVLRSASVPHRHLVYRVGDRHNNIWNLHSHSGPVGSQNPIAPETDPYAAYARIFTFDSNDAAARAALLERLARRRSALDLVLGEANTLKDRLGHEDRQRVDQHMEALRDIERTLQTPPEQAACAPVELGARIDPYNGDNHVLIGHLFFKISAMAFACDLTRVINFNWAGNTNNRVYRNLGHSQGHHDISHEGTADSFVQIRAIHRHLWAQTTQLYEDLKAIPEADGSLWDNTLVVHWNELGQGDSHTIRDNLVVLAGGAQGHFRRGRLLDLANQASFADMLVSCFHYMGFEDVRTFGDARLGSGGALPNLT